jgi:NADH-quinone oxidoreductase subunit N
MDLFTSLRKEFGLIVPMAQLALFGLTILLTEFLLPKRLRYLNAVLATAAVLFSGFALWKQRTWNAEGFNGSVVIDPFFVFFGFLFLAATALVIFLSVRYMEIEGEHRGEYYSLMLFATVGMMFMACGNDLVVLFVGLETMALSFYVLAGFLRKDKRSNEGALKYLLLGAFSSGMLAYGFSILYGIAGSTNLSVIQKAVALRPNGDVLVLLALVTTSAGLFFKIAAVPFHQWAPDVYEGAPTSITAYLSVASKTASFALLLRVFLVPFASARPNWELLLAVIAVASMTIGNFAAITQTNVKRLLAYSSIAHVGYILLGLVSGNATGLKGVAYYLLAYAFMNTGAFAIVILLRRKGVIGDELEDLNGLSERNPGAALMMLIFLVSLAGIPPTAGFVGKLFIFWSLIETQHYLLAVFAALYIVPAVYYYMRLAVAMYMSESVDQTRPAISPAQGFALALAIVITLVAGVWPEPFVKLASYSLSLPIPR